jgi:anti-sigma regulatory factor (Ser/Thr protein kinase)
MEVAETGRGAPCAASSVGGPTTRLRIAEESQVGEGRREAAAIAKGAGFDETQAGKVAIIVTELARNLVRHATGGELLLRVVPGADPVIDLLALDRGPGMANVAHCLRDGYSTAGTPGTGLGAVSRLAGTFDIHSVPGVGTAILARVRSRPAAEPARQGGPAVGAVCLAKAGESVSGDAWATAQRDGRAVFLVTDGLGHGPGAAEASTAAVEAFEQHLDEAPEGLLKAIHAALRPTRGAAAAVAEIGADRQTVRFAGVGNIAGAIITGAGERHMVSHNGILGHDVRKFQEFAYPLPADALMVMHSDGLLTQWGFARYPSLRSRDPGLVAGVLYRDFARGRDDVTVLAARAGSSGARR